jgi:DNA-binding CsgD family transcriptional regulator
MELVRQYEAGASATDLANTFEINRSSVYNHLKRHNAQPRRYRKLRGEPLEEAIRLRQAGLSVRAIGRTLGLNRGTVATALGEV